MTSREFIRVWRRWDQNPKSERNTNEYAEIASTLARRYGMPTNDLREFLAERRRVGRSYAEAVSDLQERFGAIW